MTNLPLGDCKLPGRGAKVERDIDEYLIICAKAKWHMGRPEWVEDHLIKKRCLFDDLDFF